MKKYTEGKALIIVIIIIAMLLILAPAIVISSNTEVFQTTRYDNRMQAYLYARSGIDAALGWLIQDGELNSNFKASTGYNGLAYMKGSLDNMSISDTEQNIDSDISVSMMYTPLGVIISSTGVYNDYSREIQLTMTLTTIKSPAFEMPDKALFVQNTDPDNVNVLDLTGNAGVIGNFGALTLTYDALNFGNQQYIEGDIYLNADNFEVMDTDDPFGVLTSDEFQIITSADMAAFPPPLFPDLPDILIQYDETQNLVDASGNLLNNTTGAELDLQADSSTAYVFGDFTVKKLLNINLNYEDRVIVVDTLDIGGDINLINTGASGTLSIFVKESITISSAILNGGAAGGDPLALNIYYSGESEPDFNGNAKVYGSIITKTSDLIINGNVEVHGHIIVGGVKAQINGVSVLDSRLVYAPNAHVVIAGTAQITGAVVADTAKVIGTGDIIYQPMDISSLPPGVFPDPNDPAYINSLTTQIINTYYWE